MTYYDEQIYFEEEETPKKSPKQKFKLVLVFVMIAVIFFVFQINRSNSKNSHDPSILPYTDWFSILVSEQHAFPKQFKLEASKIEGDFAVDSRTASSLQELLAQAEQDNISLKLYSAYFDKKTQSKYNPSDVSLSLSEQMEHQTGLAIDFTTQELSSLSQEFENTKAFAWLSEHAWRYGYILRYPKDKEDITGVDYAPWHYRYVGVELADYLRSENLCLEEYIIPKPSK